MTKLNHKILQNIKTNDIYIYIYIYITTPNVKNSNLDKTKQSNGDKFQKLKIDHNYKCDKTPNIRNSRTQIALKMTNLNCDKTLKKI